jgi:5-methylcytosine-specific restriction protein B
MGRYVPGTSRGHIVYFRREDGSFYKNRLLNDLSDEEALRYTLKIQHTIAAADVSQDISWIDDDAEIYRRAGVEPRVTVGDGRKLRLLACYNPDVIVPITSSEHLRFFLEALGTPRVDIPPSTRPIARMNQMLGYFELAKQKYPDLTPFGFMSALYNPKLGLRPPKVKAAPDEDDDDGLTASAYLLTWNPKHFEIGGDGGVVPGTEQRWTCHSKRPRLGDRVYLVRLGVEPRGIVATGTVTGESQEAPHWKDPSKKARYIRFQVEEFRPSAATGLLPMALLESVFPDHSWSPQRSGVGIPAEIETILARLWTEGAGVHSLRQYVKWATTDIPSKYTEWLHAYRDTVQLARSLQGNPTRIDEAALNTLWREIENGISSVGPGSIPLQEFQANTNTLNEYTRAILAEPTSRTLSEIENRWQRAVSEGAFGKMRRVVIRRVFAAISPESYTTLLREADCQKVLALFKRQFELSPSTTSATDWAALNADLVSCLRQAGLSAEHSVENNTAIWRLVEYLSTSRDGFPGDTEPGDPSRPGGPPGITVPRNLVLYGPPGTGKTYHTIQEAIELLAPELLEGEPDRAEIKAQFDDFVAEGRIVFTTFHQSFSYEDFVEGIRADTDESGQIRYRVVDGVFKQLCNFNEENPTSSEAARPQVYSAGDKFAGYTVQRASSELLELTKPNGNELAFSMRLLNELATMVRDGRLTTDDIRQKKVFEKAPDTKLEPYLVNGYANILPQLVDRLVSTEAAAAPTPSRASSSPPRVLIIDEINRGNVSRIFGELITLIEPSKRRGMSEALEVTLPYSKSQFSVPANLHIIATMNTADRSLVGMDIALRRRFEFREMHPDTSLLEDLSVEGIPVSELIAVMNSRIETLLDRDHRLGHAYFLSLRDAPSLTQLERIFRRNVLPLLQEYFFEDWQRIHWVLNDHRKPEPLQIVTRPTSQTSELFGEGVPVNEQNVRWYINDAALSKVEAYARILG